MLRYLLILFAITLGLRAQVNFNFYSFLESSPQPAGTSFLWSEYFEETGTPSGVTEETATADFDYTTTVLEGSESCHMDGSAQPTWRAPDWSNVAGVRIKFRFRLLQQPAANEYLFRLAENGSASYLYDITIRSTGALRAQNGSGSALTSGTVSINTTYYVWVYELKGTGSDGYCSIAFATSDVEPTTGSNFASASGGTRTTDIGRIRWQASDNVTHLIYVIDAVEIEEYIP